LDVIISILQYLPVSSIRTVALSHELFPFLLSDPSVVSSATEFAVLNRSLPLLTHCIQQARLSNVDIAGLHFPLVSRSTDVDNPQLEYAMKKVVSNVAKDDSCPSDSLLAAVDLNWLNGLKLLLEYIHGNKVIPPRRQLAFHSMALCRAIYFEHEEILEYLLDIGKQKYMKAEVDIHAIRLAVAQARLDTLKFLLNNKRSYAGAANDAIS
jgi:hypothetical protein